VDAADVCETGVGAASAAPTCHKDTHTCHKDTPVTKKESLCERWGCLCDRWGLHPVFVTSVGVSVTGEDLSL